MLGPFFWHGLQIRANFVLVKLALLITVMTLKILVLSLHEASKQASADL